MNTPTTEQLPVRKRLRVWPGVAIVTLQWLSRFAIPAVIPEAAMIGVMAGLAGGPLVLVWWLFFSRAQWLDRMLGVLLMTAIPFAVAPFLHPSIATGMMGMMYALYVVPVLSLAVVLWAVAASKLPTMTRQVSLVATILLASGSFLALRTGGITGDGDSDFRWRWSKTPEEQLLIDSTENLAATPIHWPESSAAQWPGFRGPARDAVVPGSAIARDWSSAVPTELWRQPVGPGWSSFAVWGDAFYTQEQRGDEEAVSCYRLSTGKLIWRHADDARFWESNAGAGPRGTPTLDNGVAYSLGATGIVNALDAKTGSVLWSRNAKTDADVKTPGWGFSGSPLVHNDLVVVAASGRLVAYDRTSGEPRWLGPRGGISYSSPHLVTFGGVQQILLLSEQGATSVAPADGKVLWTYEWRSDGVVQPAMTPDGDLLIGTGSGMGKDAGMGVRRVALSTHGEQWTPHERWTSVGLKPYFNDYIIHNGHAYGFDGRILACIDLASGERKWKGGRYGHGQVIGLPDQNLLLVLSEQGDVALVNASTERFEEIAKFTAISGKTWNHPVLVGDVLLVRNAEEMAAFRIPLANQ